MRSVIRIPLPAVLAVLVALALAGLLTLAFHLWARTDTLQNQTAGIRAEMRAELDAKDRLALEKDLLQLENAIGTARGQIFGSLAQLAVGAAVLGGLVFTWRNLRVAERNAQIAREQFGLAQQQFAQSTANAQETLKLSERAQATERFTKAIGQLGDGQLAVRLGGIYALEQLSRDAPQRYHWTVVEVLTAFVRERAPWREEEAAVEPEPAPAPATDVQAVLTVLGRRDPSGETAVQRIDLTKTDLRRAYLAQVHLERASLLEAHLEGAYLRGGRLQGAILRRAHLEDAVLREAHLEGADLRRVHLTGADLGGAHLEGTDLRGAAGLTMDMIEQASTNDRTDLGDLRRYLADRPSTTAEPDSC